MAALINRTPTTLHHMHSPYEILHSVKPDYKVLRVFGSACYAHSASTRINLAKEVVYVFLWVILSVKRLEGLWYWMQWVCGFSWCHFPRGCFSFCLTKFTPYLKPNPVSCDEDWILTPSVDRGILRTASLIVHITEQQVLPHETEAQTELVHQALPRNRGSNRVFELHPLVIHHQLNVSNNKLLKWLQLKFRNQNKLRLRTLVKVNMTSQDRISCRTAFSTSQLQHPIDTSHVFSNFFIVSENWFRYITVPSVFRG